MDFLILFQLICYVRFYCFRVLPHSIRIISLTSTYVCDRGILFPLLFLLLSIRITSSIFVLCLLLSFRRLFAFCISCKYYMVFAIPCCMCYTVCVNFHIGLLYFLLAVGIPLALYHRSLFCSSAKASLEPPA